MPRREFVARGAYHLLRHPVYLSFLGLIWFIPTMTLDHAELTGVWTIYIGIGSILKDHRLLFYLGDPYAQYMHRAAGYPLMLNGPLATVSSQTSVLNNTQATDVAFALKRRVQVCSAVAGSTQRRST